ncbi:MAG: AAA family ATPase [Candidatus Falkowbacteria bacterium]
MPFNPEQFKATIPPGFSEEETKNKTESAEDTEEKEEEKNKQELRSIQENENSVSYLGVKLEKAENRDSELIPKKEKYQDYINDQFSLELQKKIAISFSQGDPILIEGGTSIGKTTTVRKMASELGYETHYANLNGATDVEDLMGRYIPNPKKAKQDDPEYIFADGKATSGLRQEQGKKKIIILDELNSASPNILIRLHEVLDALERGEEVVLSEDASETVKTNKEKTKIVALMNPPGKGYFGREPLDPAQLRRWVYQKEATDLPKKTFSHSTQALFNLAPKSEEAPKESFIISPDQKLDEEQLAEIPGIKEIVKQYEEFHNAAKEMLKNRSIAEDQPQPFNYDDRMEPRRVRDFILKFYSGDISETAQTALRYYYANKLESDEDKAKLEELIRNIKYVPKTEDSKRKGLDRGAEDEEKSGVEISAELKENIKEQYAEQRQILEKTGILERLSTGEIGIIGIDKKEYSIPSYEDIEKQITENKEMIEKKQEQGFIRLQLTPFGMSLDKLIEKYKKTILEHHKEGKLLATKKDPSDPDEQLELNESNPIDVWEGYNNADKEGKIVYYPKEFSENHQGKTKQELLKSELLSGWNIMFTENLPNIPREEKGKEVGGRKQLEADQSAKEYLEKIQTDPIYKNEQGMTPEDQLTYAITHLQKTNQVIDDCDGNGSVSRQFGAYFSASGFVPSAYWNRVGRQARLAGSGPDVQNDYVGARSGVPLRARV